MCCRATCLATSRHILALKTSYIFHFNLIIGNVNPGHHQQRFPLPPVSTLRAKKAVQPRAVQKLPAILKQERIQQPQQKGQVCGGAS